MMDNKRTEALRRQAEDTLQPLLAETEAIFKIAQERSHIVESQNDEWMALYNRFSLASGGFPFAPYHNYYFEGLAPATEPLFHPVHDELSERYRGFLRRTD